MSQILNTLQREFASKYVKFDATDKNHLEAYYKVRYQGKLDSNFRFYLEEPFMDCVSMMQHKIAQEYINNALGTRDFSF